MKQIAWFKGIKGRYGDTDIIIYYAVRDDGKIINIDTTRIIMKLTFSFGSLPVKSLEPSTQEEFNNAFELVTKQ